MKSTSVIIDPRILLPLLLNDDQDDLHIVPLNTNVNPPIFPMPVFGDKDNDEQNSFGNNVYIFPGLGHGAICCGATRVTDKMLMVFLLLPLTSYRL